MCVGCLLYSCHLRTAALPSWRNSLEICKRRLVVCLFFPTRFLKAVFQGDGLEIVRLILSVGWELPLGRNAKGCLEAVKATAGELIPDRKKGVLFLIKIHF